MKRRILAGLMGLCIALALIGCSGSGTEVKNSKITIKQYKGLEVDKVEVEEVTDEDVESQIQTNLYDYSTTNDITDRPAQEGDTVVIDYVGKIDGEAFDGGTAESQSITIGAGGYISGFEDGIVGHSVGETFDVDVTFPDSYGNTDLAGKAAVFTMTLHSITERIYPELTDELVAELSETSTTPEEYRAEIRKQLEEANEETANSTLLTEVWNALIENCEIKTYPEDKLTEVTENITSQFSTYASYYGVEVSDLIEQFYGVTLDEMAKQLIKQEYAVELIAEKENLEITDEEYQKSLAEYAEQYGYDDASEFEETVGKEEIEKTILQNKVGQFLVDNCTQV